MKQSFLRVQHLMIVAFAASLLVVTDLCAEDLSPTWTQWRGPNRNSHVKGEAWPNSLSESHLKQLWVTKLGPSYSGPIVNENNVYVTETVNGTDEVVRALNRKTGEELWQQEWKGAMKVPFFAAANGSWIRATPILDDDRLYVAGMRDVLVCLEASTGEIRWSADLMKRFNSPLPAFGFASSPLIHKRHVIVQAGGGVVKLDKMTGETVWRGLVNEGGMSGSAFSSPVVATISGREQLLVQARNKLSGLELTNGTELWSQKVPAFRGMNILTPTVLENSVFTSSYGAGSYRFGLESSGNENQVRELWKNKLQGYMSSPVVIDNHAYIHLRNQRFACIDLSTGEERWITTPYGKYWSMIAQGDRILALDERGDLLLIQANTERFELIDSRHISDQPTWAHLAISGNDLFIRSLNSQMAFQWK